MAGSTVTLDSTSGEEQLVVRMGVSSGAVRVEHPGGSSIELKDDGTVTIKAAANLKLEAKSGDITLDAKNVLVKVETVMDVS